MHLKTNWIIILTLIFFSINDLISNNVSTMRKLILKLDAENENKFKEAKNELTRSYAQVHISFTEFTKNTGLWLTSNYCSRLRVLEITYMKLNIEDVKLFKKTFQALHHLEKVIMLQFEIDGYENSMQTTIEPAKVESLKSIEMYNTHLAFLLCVTTPNLTCLKIAGNSDLESAAIIPLFLAGLTKLEKLALWKADFEDFEQIEESQLTSINTPLRNLSLRQLKNPFQSNENLMEFLKRFYLTLEELDMGKFTEPLPESAYEIIFNQFHRLKTLRVFVESAPKKTEFYHKLQANPSITKLIVSDIKQIETQALFGLLSKLPNLDTLIINAESVNQEMLLFIATNAANLKTLAVKKIFGIATALRSVQMRNLRHLIICDLKFMKADGWKAFVKAFTNIESLSIHNTDSESFNSLNFNIFTKGLHNMKQFNFGEGFEASKRVFNQMVKNCKKLQSIQVIKSSFEKDQWLFDKISRDIRDRPGFQLICSDLHNVCDVFDNGHGTSFWKANEEFDDTIDDEDEDDEDIYDDSDYDFDDEYDSDDMEGDVLGMENLIGILARAAHGPGKNFK